MSPSLPQTCVLFCTLALLTLMPVGPALAADMDSVKEKIDSIFNKSKDKASELLEKGSQLGKDLLEEGKVLRDDAVRKGDELLDSLDKALDGKPEEPQKNEDKNGGKDIPPATPVQTTLEQPATGKADKPAASTADKPATSPADKLVTSHADTPAASPAAKSDTPK